MTVLMIDQVSSEEILVRTEVHSDKVFIIEAECINCNKRLNSMHSVSMHLKGTAGRHSVIFINYGDYDKKTGLRCPNMQYTSSAKQPSAMRKTTGCECV